MNIKHEATAQGVYTGLTIIRNKGKPSEYREELPGFKNLILDGFFTRWPAGALSTGGWRFFVGTGSTAPIASESALVSQIGSASDGSNVTTVPTFNDGTNYYAAVDQVTQWALGAIVGNISEIGICFRNRTTGDELDSRALIKDALGEPTTITLTADDQLVINYRFIIKLPITQHSGTFTIKDTLTNFTLETLNVNNSFGASWTVASYLTNPPFSMTSPKVENRSTLYNDVTAAPTGGTQYLATSSGEAVGTTRRLTISANSSQLNVPGGVNYLVIRAGTNNARQGILFDPPIDKTSLDTMTLSFDYSLARE